MRQVGPSNSFLRWNLGSLFILLVIGSCAPCLSLDHSVLPAVCRMTKQFLGKRVMDSLTSII